MKKFLLCLIVFFCAVPELFAKTYIKTGSEVVPSYETKERVIGFLKQKLTKEAIAEEGTFIFGTLKIREDTLSNSPEIEEEITSIIGSSAKVKMIGEPETFYTESNGYKAEHIKITLRIYIDRDSAKKQVDSFISDYLKGKLANKQYKDEIESLKQKNELLEKNRIEAEKLSKEISRLKQKQNQYSYNNYNAKNDEPMKWEISVFGGLPEFEKKKVIFNYGYGSYTEDIGSPRYTIGGSVMYSPVDYFAFGVAYEKAIMTSRDVMGYIYDAYIAKMKFTINPSNDDLRFYIPVSVGNYSLSIDLDYWTSSYTGSNGEYESATIVMSGIGIELGISRHLSLGAEYLLPAYQSLEIGKIKNSPNVSLKYRW